MKRKLTDAISSERTGNKRGRSAERTREVEVCAGYQVWGDGERNNVHTPYIRE